MNAIIDEMTYLNPGQLVTLRQDIPNKPVMIVNRIERSIMKKSNGRSLLKGVKCRWFTEDGFLQEAVFSTKDLILV